MRGERLDLVLVVESPARSRRPRPSGSSRSASTLDEHACGPRTAPRARPTLSCRGSSRTRTARRGAGRGSGRRRARSRARRGGRTARADGRRGGTRPARGRRRARGSGRRRRLAATPTSSSPRYELDAHAAAGSPAPVSSTWVESETLTGANLRACTRCCARDLVLVGAHEAAVADDLLAADVEPVDAVRRRRGRGRRPDPRRPPSSSASVRQTARSARLPGSSEPMSSRRSTAAPPRVPSRSASRAVIASGPPRPRATSSACLTSRNRSLRSFDAEPSTPSPTRTPASSSSRTGATPAPSRRFEVGQCATPVPVVGEAPHVVASERWTQCAHQTSSASQPSCSRYSTGGSRRARGSTPPPRPSRRGACAAAGRAGARARPTRPSARPVTENGEHGATATLDASLVQRRAAPSRRGSSSGSSTSASGGSPPSDSPRSIEPRDATIRTPSSRAAAHLRLDDARLSAREDVVVVEDGRAAGERELREPGARGRVLGLARRCRAQTGYSVSQPGEQVGLLRPRAREGLVEVVVRVDEAGRDERAAEVDPLVSPPARAPPPTAPHVARPRSATQPSACSVPASSIVDDVGVAQQCAHARSGTSSKRSTSTSPRSVIFRLRNHRQGQERHGLERRGELAAERARRIDAGPAGRDHLSRPRVGEQPGDRQRQLGADVPPSTTTTPPPSLGEPADGARACRRP